MPPPQAIKDWIPDYEPDLDWFNRPRNFFFPLSGPATGSIKGLSAKSKFLGKL